MPMYLEFEQNKTFEFEYCNYYLVANLVGSSFFTHETWKYSVNMATPKLRKLYENEFED